ncbi:tripartite motif-containing protein 10-like isoform X2 [Tiliqua scincoides]|uniref:tripartite motif-containing protein 10-like isoform X2 n=1 Tax=Tiliqua scincoides TaxID=71010 RepID=UPI003462B297
MAAPKDIQDLCDEATCPICLDYFRDPVIIVGCGHNFCRACLAQSWGEKHVEASCPQCREAVQDRSFIPNRQLANFVEITKKLRLGGQGAASGAERICKKHQEPLKLFCKDHQAPICLVCVTSKEHESHKVVPREEAFQEYKGQRRAREVERVCKKHQEPLKLFCRDHQAPICVVCDKSKEHESHKVVPLEEAFQEYQDQIRSRLKTLRAEREKIQICKADTEKKSQDLLNQTEEERQKTKAEFRQIHHFLEQQEQSLLDQIGLVQKEISRRREEHLARLCRELFSLEHFIQEMGEKCQQPASEFLWDIGRTLQRSEKVFENPVAFPPELICRIRGFCDVKHLLEGVKKQFPELASCSSNKAVVDPPIMATASMEEELKCPICKEILTDPVTVDCGHNFCRGCISRYCETWEDMGEDLECPLCKARIKKVNFRPNWQLANIVEKIKLLQLNPKKEDLCVRHKERLHLFCKEDKELVCLFCERSPEHQSHTILLLDEAAKEYKDQISIRLKILRAERENIQTLTADVEKESQDLLNQTVENRKKIMAEFRQIHEFLEEQERGLLAQMERAEKEIARRRIKHLDRLYSELFSLEILIQEMEEKCQQPTSEFLQDLGKTLQRSEEKEAFENPVAFPSELTCKIREFCDIKPLLDSVMKQFPANVTLDPDTAHPQLILSEDCKSVRWGDKRQDLLNNPERFDLYPVVLGHEGFTEGRHFWEVTVQSEEFWAVGVAKKSVRRKGKFNFSPKEGIWAVGKWGGKYIVYILPHYTLSLRQELKRVQVILKCPEGQVAFYDADTKVHIYTHSGASFCGETLLPFFYVFGEAHLKFSP